MLRYNFESNSQRWVRRVQKMFVGNYMLKYNFESNSQPQMIIIPNYTRWELYAKIQF